MPAASAITGTMSFSASDNEYALSNSAVIDVPPAKSILKFNALPFVFAKIGMKQKPITMTRTEAIIQYLPPFTKLTLPGSFALPKNFTSFTPSVTSAFNTSCETTSAVNTDNTIPIASVIANPLIVPVPKIPSTSAAIRVVTLPSMIADNALWNPAFTDCLTEAPVASSSLIRVKITTFASTAIPTERMIPARPGSVNVTLNRFITSKTINV